MYLVGKGIKVLEDIVFLTFLIFVLVDAFESILQFHWARLGHSTSKGHVENILVKLIDVLVVNW